MHNSLVVLLGFVTFGLGEESNIDDVVLEVECLSRGPWPSCVYTLLRKDGTNRFILKRAFDWLLICHDRG